MKIAVASNSGDVAQHFGHCESFNVFNTKDGDIVTTEIFENPGHKPGFLPNYLNDLGVNVIISGGMGGGAIDIFNQRGIEVIVGSAGSSKTSVELYLDGKLKSTGSVCHEHKHESEGCSQ